MALSLMFRNSTKLRGISTLPRCTFQLQQNSRKNFTQLVTRSSNTGNLSLASKCRRIQFVKIIIEQQKRNMSADHSKLWPIEKFVSLVLLGTVPAVFICPNKILDNILAVAVVMHFHWGLEACVVDYIRPIIFGSIIPKIALLLLYVVSASTLAGLVYFNQHQCGIGQTFRQFWCISGTPEDNIEQEEIKKSVA